MPFNAVQAAARVVEKRRLLVDHLAQDTQQGVDYLPIARVLFKGYAKAYTYNHRQGHNAVYTWCAGVRTAACDRWTALKAHFSTQLGQPGVVVRWATSCGNVLFHWGANTFFMCVTIGVFSAYFMLGCYNHHRANHFMLLRNGCRAAARNATALAADVARFTLQAMEAEEARDVHATLGAYRFPVAVGVIIIFKFYQHFRQAYTR